MYTADFDYDLPPELIAQEPAAQRDESRLMVLDRNTQKIEHRTFKEIVDYLKPDDLLVLNNTRVIPARLIGKKETGGRVKVLLLNKTKEDLWEVLVDVGRGLKSGKRLTFGEDLKAEVVDEPKEGGVTTVKFKYAGDFEEILERLGEIPLPPYIKTGDRRPETRDRYQTVYAKVPGATAAPTAGLHFTEELLKKIKNKVFITLHTGYSTFKPVTAQVVEDYKMSKEYFEISEDAAKAINSASGRIITVGTTTVRALETTVKAGKGSTDLFIYPGYRFKIVDAMVTNFHLPKSTLLMLVSAFAGLDFIKKAYEEAIRKRYRFYSFGDAMLIL